RVRVGFVGHPVGGPAGVRDAGAPVGGRRLPQRIQSRNLAGRTQAAQLSAVQHGQAGRVVAAVFEGVQPGKQDGDDVTLGAAGNDSTHGPAPGARSKNVKIQGFGSKRATFPDRWTEPRHVSCRNLQHSPKFEPRHIRSIKALPSRQAVPARGVNTGGRIMFRLFRQRALRWQLLLVLVEFALLVGCVYAAVVLRYWGDLGTQAAFGNALHWRAPLAALVLILAMTALGLYQVHLRASWLGRLSRQGVAFVLGGVALTVLYYAMPAAYIGRGVLGITLVLGYLMLALWRVLFLGFVDADLFKRRVVMLGAGQRAAEVFSKMRRKTDQRGFKILGYVPIGADPVTVPQSSL